jgi:hypothetical protein
MCCTGVVHYCILLCIRSNVHGGGYSANSEQVERDMKIITGVVIGGSFLAGVGSTLLVLKLLKKI